ncbi:MAG: amino acid adenylation domain-containing protein [Selenomonadaceae bacterium]|nr:amino acid adenylation domain-containing protein [Selenomonadaceae bacterium]
MDIDLKKILEVSTGEKFSYDTSKTFLDLFKIQVEKNSDKIAVADENSEMTYKELDELSDKVASWLIDNEVSENEFVAIRMGRVKEFIVAAIGIWKVGAAYLPIDFEYPAGRIAYMLEDSETKITITEKIITEILETSEKISKENYKTSPENLAYMIYTSGSTGKPKGVMIQHKAVLNFIHFIKERWGLTENSRIACHSNFAFDASVENLYPALITGGTVFIVPEDARRDVFEMQKFIEQKKINGGSYTTRFGQMLTGEKLLDVDYICLGGEVMTSVPNVRGKIFNAYGPTEFTVGATYFELEKDREYNPIPIGRPLYNCSAFIVDKENKLLPLGEIGELCLAGSQLAKGYWKRPELTSEKFNEIQVGEEKIKVYHTGDLAKYNDDGNLEFCGRMDFQVKLRGFRIELGEIETCAAKFSGIVQVAAEVKQDTLCLYYTAQKNIDKQNLKNFMAESLTDYMVPQIFIRLDEMPMTPNGKLDRKVLPEPILTRASEYIEPRTEFEKIVVDCMKKVLGKNIKIGAADNFFELGGDSIKAIRVVSLLREQKIIVKVTDVLKLRTVEKIAACCKFGEELPQKTTIHQDFETAKKIATASDLGETQWSDEEFNSVVEEFSKRGEKLKKIYPLTPLQEGMLREHVTNPTSPAYRLVDIYELNFLPTEKNLREALDKLADKHEIFRTAIIHEGVSIYRQAITDRKIPLKMLDLSGEENKFDAAKKIREEILKNGFDLQKKSLIQFICAKTSENSCYLIIAVHHIIVDGWCVLTYLKDFENFLQNPEIEISSEIFSYENAVREIISKDKNSAVEYFKKVLEGYDNKAEIPSHGKISADEKYFDNQTVKVIDAEKITKLKNICRKIDATLANGFELVWGTVLQTFCRMEDIVFAKVVSGRDKNSFDVSNMVGLFINSIPVRVKTEKNSTVFEMLKNLREQSIEGNEFDFCPLADIQKAVGMSDGLIYSMMSFENYGDEKLSVLKPVLKKEEHFGGINIAAKIQDDGSLSVVISFDSNKYRVQEIERIFSLMENYIEKFSENPEAVINSIPHLNKIDEEKIIELSQGEKLEYDSTKTFLDLFRVQAEKNPDKIAVVDENSEMTYKELDETSDKVAAWLNDNGVAENEFVAVRMDRKKEFVAAVVGIWKVGAAYVPIDLDYPADRVEYMLSDSAAKITLNEENITEILKNSTTQKIYKNSPENLAYMIYTSGSTGKPKGVMIPHKALLNFVHVVKKLVGLTENSRISCHPNFAFDASVEDLYPTLIAGGTLFIVPEDIRKDIFEMRKFIEKNKITGGSYSMRFGQMLTSNGPLDLDYVVLGGEAMTQIPNISGKVFNGYGPTEFNVATTYFEVDKNKEYNPLPIGRPVYNCACYIVDKNNRLVPRGAVGELCAAGVQLAKGYLNRPELTAEKFSDIEIGGRKIKVYHTGDLARYNEDGQIEFFGRIDFQVKLRGFRIELGEIEDRAAKFSGIVHAVAEVKKNTLCLYYTAEKNIDENNFKKFLAESLTDYMVPQIFICMEKMPMTPSGKINRNLLPVPDFSARQTEYEPPKNLIEKKLCAAFEKVLGMKENSVGRNDDFYLIGGDSLKSMLVMTNAGIVGLSAKDIFKFKTPCRISEELSTRKNENIDKIEDEARKEIIPATTAQIQMIDYQFLNVNSTMYNLAGLYKLNANLDAEKLAEAVNKVAIQHPAICSTFAWGTSGDIVQSVRPELLEKVSVEEISESDIEQLSKTLMQPFQLFGKPLFRAKVFKCGEKVYLFIDMHHTISDGTSFGNLLEDISRAYYGEELPKDFYYTYLLQEHEKFSSAEYKTAKKYFQNLLENKNWCKVPTPDYESWDANLGEEKIDPEISIEKLAETEKRLGFSRNVISITAAILALRDYCQETSIRVDFLNNNRTEKYLRNAVGLIFKILPVALELENYSTLEQLLREVSRQVTESFANSVCDYSSEDNVALRDALLINYISDMGNTAAKLKSFEPEEIPLISDKRAATGHVDIYLMEDDGNLQIVIEYQRNAYAEESMRKFLDIFVKHFKMIVNKN